MAKDMKFQQQLVDKLKQSEEYEEASIYTIMLDLVSNNGVQETFLMLHNVCTDLDKREDLESQYEKSKNFEWK